MGMEKETPQAREKGSPDMPTPPPNLHHRGNDLRDDANIVIRPADKGGGVVIQSYQQYKCEIMRQLNDTSTYRKLTYDPVLAFQNKIQQLIDMGLQAGYIDSNTAKYLLVIHPIHPVLYTLPKIHKSSHNPPGRPIVSA
ncbi:Hypothetical predicted protein, partial [Pelobates cultripes]